MKRGWVHRRCDYCVGWGCRDIIVRRHVEEEEEFTVLHPKSLNNEMGRLHSW